MAKTIVSHAYSPGSRLLSNQSIPVFAFCIGIVCWCFVVVLCGDIGLVMNSTNPIGDAD